MAPEIPPHRLNSTKNHERDSCDITLWHSLAQSTGDDSGLTAHGSRVKWVNNFGESRESLVTAYDTLTRDM